jgi:flavin reductase (DIM6/NTAB) family NADH-FMN oxidoreductase RutF
MQRKVPYRRAIDRKYPEQIVIAIAKDRHGKCNPITLGWSMVTSHRPPMMAVSIGLTRYSHEVFQAAEQFVIAMPSEQQADEVLLFGTRSGRDCDKLADAGGAVEPAAKIDCVILSDAVANFELVKRGQLLTGDHTIFAGEVVASHVNEQGLNRLYTVGAGWKLGGLAREE